MTDFTPHNAPAKELHQLPVMATTRPIGRDDLLKEIYENLRDAGAVLLHGVSGAGKTTIGAALAAAYTQQAGGVLWLDGHLGDFTSLLVQVGRAYALQEVTTSDNPQAHIGIVSATLMQNKPFIVVDNVPNVMTVAPFIDKVTGKLPTLLIAEQAFEGKWARVEVDKLGDIDALTLFKQKAGIADGNQDIAIYGIAKQLGYQAMPLAIAARGMVAAKQDADTYGNTLKEITKTIGGDATVATIATSYRALNNALQGLLLMMGASPTGTASAPLLALLSNLPTNTIDQAMTILTQLFLVEKVTRYDVPFYRLHPIVHRFTVASLKNSNRLAELQEKFQDALITYARQNSTQRNYPLLANEMENFIAIARQATNEGNRDIANQLLVTLTQADDFVSGSGYVYELLLLRALGSGSTAAFPAYGADAVTSYEDDDFSDDDDFDEFEDDDFSDDDDFDDFEDDDFGSDDDFEDDSFGDDDDFDDDFDDDDAFEESLDRVRTPASMGLAPVPSVSLEEASLEELRTLLQQAKEQRDTPRILDVLNAIGKAQIAQGRNQEAITTYDEILQIQDARNGEGEVVATLDMLASLLNKTGNPQPAIMHATRGVQITKQTGDDEMQMQFLMQLGDARQELGESDSAVSTYSDALTIARQTDDSQHEALILYKLGYAYLDEGEPDTAIHAWTQARDLFKGQGKRDYEGRVMGALGTAHADMGN